MAGEDLDAIAAAELIQEAKRGAERAKEMGAMGWRKCPVPTANKVFLNNTVLGILGHSKRHQRDREKSSKEQSFSKYNSSSSRRDSRKQTYSSISPKEQKISSTDRKDKELECISFDKRSDRKNDFSSASRKHSYSSHFPFSYKEDRESKYKKKRTK